MPSSIIYNYTQFVLDRFIVMKFIYSRAQFFLSKFERIYQELLRY